MGDLTRKDLHQTSSGVGHNYTQGYYFPSSRFQSVIKDPVPAKLAVRDEYLDDNRLKTTAQTLHDGKYMGIPYGNTDPVYRKAPGHWKVDYGRNFNERLASGGYRRPLTMGNQTSEAHDQYRNQPAMRMDSEFTPNPQGHVLSNHHTNGPSKEMVPSTQNAKLQGRPYFVKDIGVLQLNDPYLTTTGKTHRAFKPAELNGYAKKNVPTFWACDEYPKAWGHGPHENPLPKDAVPRERLPMRNKTVFKSATTVRRIPKANVPVPHSGLISLKQESYVQPSNVKMKEIYYCPVNTPYTLPPSGPNTAFHAPHMYNSEYQNVGSGNQITI